MREEERGPHRAVAHAYKLASIAEGIVDLCVTANSKRSERSTAVRMLLLLFRRGEFVPLQQTDDGKAGIGRMKERARARVRAPVVAPRALRDEPAGQARGAGGGSGAEFVVMRRAV